MKQDKTRYRRDEFILRLHSICLSIHSPFMHPSIHLILYTQNLSILHVHRAVSNKHRRDSKESPGEEEDETVKEMDEYGSTLPKSPQLPKEPEPSLLMMHSGSRAPMFRILFTRERKKNEKHM